MVGQIADFANDAWLRDEGLCDVVGVTDVSEHSCGPPG